MVSVLRRSRAGADPPREPQRTIGDLSVDSVAHTVHLSGASARLTPTEYALLEEFLDNAGKVLPYTHLLSRVWGSTHSYERE